MKPQLDANQKAITKKIRALVPEATAIIFHGSRVRGLPAPTSDYDVMVLTPTGVDLEERKQIKAKLEKVFPAIEIDVTFGSERWMLANLGREAYLRFWLENGIATFGHLPTIEQYPPLYKDVLNTELDLLKARFLLARDWSRTLYYQARQYLRLLKRLIIIELALRQEYSNLALWTTLQQQVGMELLEILRDKTKRHRIRKPMVRRMERLVSRKIAAIRRQLKTSDLPELVQETT